MPHTRGQFGQADSDALHHSDGRMASAGRRLGVDAEVPAVLRGLPRDGDRNGSLSDDRWRSSYGIDLGVRGILRRFSCAAANSIVSTRCSFADRTGVKLRRDQMNSQCVYAFGIPSCFMNSISSTVGDVQK